MSAAQHRPIVLIFAGHDPSGGAGIQADIEAIISQGCHAVSLCTAQTVQNTQGVQRFVPSDATLLAEQARAILHDCRLAAVKIGMVPNMAVAQVIAAVLRELAPLPVVFDPVMAGGMGGLLQDSTAAQTIPALLLPHSLLTTPNSLEARQLTGCHDLPDCAAQLLQHGCRAVLITGSHEQGDTIVHTLYQQAQPAESWRCARLPGHYHGSGCTLASAIAARLARGEALRDAVTHAQRYTYESLRHAFAAGAGQRIPHRLFWAESDR